MSDKPPTPDKVGFGHPPREHQFKPGRSGNPSGRPKDRQSFSTDLIEVLDALEPGTAGNKKTNQRRIVENLVQDARTRNALALKLVVPLAVSLDKTKCSSGGELSELQQKLVDDFDRRTESSSNRMTSPSNDGYQHDGESNE